ncbi:HNH endonuclease [Luteimonas rhizosphaerae]|uniref:HNH endonuclease n=1 Tax=Luteimonas sp. 4-12 TaxID=2027406 RepID=UPI0013044862|nr:HNH endonuclease [Luteimonas sp. 4-12]
MTALVVSKGTGKCSAGLEREFGISDDEAERQKLYRFWKDVEADRHSQPDTEPADATLEERASKFARQAVRPQQQAFRKSVYIDFNEACAISGCSIRSTLDAAHLTGRSWRKGHNKASDGLLLRKDLHALYDAGLLGVDKVGRVTISDSARDHYDSYHGVTLAKRRSK